MPNTLYYGDNLDILRRFIPDGSVDLIYLDPPFNSSLDYNVLFREKSGDASPAQIRAFTDTWTWDQAAEAAYAEIVQTAPYRVRRMIAAMDEIMGPTEMMAYLVMMTLRIVELHRVLKRTGTLYLHCDPTASHYLKIILDTVFGPKQFRNEIVWKRTTAHSSAKKYAPIHDILLYYVKSGDFVWNMPRTAYEQSYLDKYYRFHDGDGRLYWRDNLCAAGVRKGRSGLPWRGIDPSAKGMHWKFTIDRLEELDAEGRIYWPKHGVMPQYKRYRDELKGKAVGDIWEDIDRINPVGNERLGYPTQKPIALLQRIVAASSNPGDTVLDPFCGCGTAVAAAQKLGRKWIGIDITYLAVALIKGRMKAHFGDSIDIKVAGVPMEIGAARDLAQRDRYGFQYWALSLINALPAESDRKKGADRGIDGIRPFHDDNTRQSKRCVVQVKSGKVGVEVIRDLRGTLEREGAEVGLLITLQDPTMPMRREAAQAGFYHARGWGRDIPRIQILTVQELLDNKKPDLPPVWGVYETAERIRDTYDAERMERMVGFD